MTAPIVQIRHTWFEYAPAHRVICDLSMDLAQGALCALIGANGTGKSTLVRMIAGILKPTAGEIRLHGTPLGMLKKNEAAKQLAYVPQSTAMAFPFTALEVVLTGRSPYRSPFRFESTHDHELALNALATVGALHLADRPVTALSGGEQQLVAVARALAQEPKCLLLDESSSSLDLSHRAALMRVLRQLRDTLGLAVLVVTHDLHLIDGHFDRIVALRGGRIVADGSPEDVLTQAVLADVYGDRTIRTRNLDARTLVWCD